MRDFDKYFIDICTKVGEMSTCDRGRVGCILVKDRRIISTGYSGSPSGTEHCDDFGHEMVDGHCVRTVHAEQNAIIQAAKYGVSTENATAYVSLTPCYTCAKMLINAGIKRVVIQNEYHDSERTKEIFIEAGVEILIYSSKLTY